MLFKLIIYFFSFHCPKNISFFSYKRLIRSESIVLAAFGDKFMYTLYQPVPKSSVHHLCSAFKWSYENNRTLVKNDEKRIVYPKKEKN